MRDDQKMALKKIKQQILAFEGLIKVTLSEYFITYEYLTEKTERLDQRIEELASLEKYQEKVTDMGCFLGIKTHTALFMIGEIGDFNRFETAPKFAGFLE